MAIFEMRTFEKVSVRVESYDDAYALLLHSLSDRYFLAQADGCDYLTRVYGEAIRYVEENRGDDPLEVKVGREWWKIKT
jgi:hypothetical protein